MDYAAQRVVRSYSRQAFHLSDCTNAAGPDQASMAGARVQNRRADATENLVTVPPSIRRTVGVTVVPAAEVSPAYFADALQVAARDAAAAAGDAGVRVLEADEERISRLVSDAGDRVWGPRGTFAPNELRALAFSGNPVHLAIENRDGDPSVVGFAVGFLGWSPGLHVHSHQAGVVEGHRRRGVGYALKLAQRATCLRHGVSEMRWTFDPLVRRNVSFNLNALGARAVAFYPDFYGPMSDSINVGDASDRLEAVWDLSRPLPSRTGSMGDRGADGPALLHERDGRPVVTGRGPVDGAVLEVPGDYEQIRVRDRELSGAWRAAIREVLVGAYAAGFEIGAVDRSGYRLVRRGEDGRP
jgi:predicted GNAT superfamily acetyltransferase